MTAHRTGDAAEFRRARAELVARRDVGGDEFCAAYSDLADGWLAGLAGAAGVGPGSGMALVAVGGYGRRELCPGSDLDLTLVHRGRGSFGSAAEAVWYPVWDAGIGLDHSVRSVRQALSVAESDLKVVLGLLDARLVAGDAAVADELAAGALERWRKRARRWLEVLRSAVTARHQQFGEVAFLLEPDLKEAQGGLRDLAALAAAAAASPVVSDPRADESLSSARRLLLSVRVQLHRQTGRAEDRLLLAEQDGVAQALGFRSGDGRPDADALMLAVAESARRIAWAGEDGWRRVASWLAGPKGRRAGADRSLGPGLVLRDGEVTVVGGADAGTDLSLPWRAAAAAAELGAPVARPSLEALGRTSPALGPDDVWPPEARQGLVSLLGTGPAGVPVLEDLDQVGVLERLLPEWAPVRHRPQRNAYHRFTVDRHLCEAAANAARLVRGVRRPDLLLVGAWLHDIGKGYPGDHTEAGTEVVGRVGRRLGFPPEDVAVLVAMVRHHLLLPDTATRRDIDDPVTIAAVARAVGDQMTLELLAALAKADGEATGPAAWGAWKAGLVERLVRRVEASLEGRPMEAPAPLPTEDHLRRMAQGGLQVSADGSSVTVIAPDRPGLLSTVAGVLALHGLGIRSADVASAEGMAVEVFEVEPATGEHPRWDGLRSDLADSLEGRLGLEARLAEKERAYSFGRRPRAARSAEPRVLVDNDASLAATVVEVRAQDRLGLLHAVTRVLAAAGLDVVRARVSTLGHEVVDSFYVRDSSGAKLTDPGRVEELERAMLVQLGQDAPDGPGR
ncbi:MAG TPA: [protein-PII] uridylyltransferase [Acidimicrobiales bacterium]|nr:[protein-PII] uridylyltransferase [Acidimicrobiales bacterium]